MGGNGGYFMGNLKGNDDVLNYYRLKQTDSYVQRVKLIDILDEPTTKVYFYPEQDKVLFKEDEVKKFTLDSYGESIPYIDGELTIFNNYYWDFWGHYLTAEGTSLYGHLKRYAYGDKDWCFPNLDLIAAKMDKSRKTVLTYLDILERYGFAFKFGVLNETRKNVEESPVFKIRKQVPLLTKKLIYGDPEIVIPEDAPPHIQKALKREQKGLPLLLRKEHEKFVEKHLKSNAAEKLEKEIDFEKVYSAWLQFGEILKQNKSKEKFIPNAQAKLVVEMNEHEKILLKFILEQAGNSFSKPSYETWFKDIRLKIDEKTYTIFTPNAFSRDWLKEKYSNFIQNCITQIEDQIDTLTFEIYGLDQ